MNIVRTGILFFILTFIAAPSVEALHKPKISKEGYRELAYIAEELDSRASQLYDEIVEGDLFHGDRRLLARVSHFAEQASQFNELFESYRTRPQAIDEEASHLLGDARALRDEISRRGFRDPHMYRDWERVVSMLNELRNIYRREWGGGRIYNYPLGRR